MGRELLSSGRVIAVGRLLLAALSLVAVVVDPGFPLRGTTATYALLFGYTLFAAAIAAATWRNWWFDAQSAGPVHAIDVGLFTGLVFLTEGYTSPFFTFFVFLLLSPAIRWGWRATALTSVLVILLLLIAGMLVVTEPQADVQRLVVRTGHVVIFALILIWFGANQWRARFHDRREILPEPASLGESPIETSLRGAVDTVGAGGGAFLSRQAGQTEFAGLAIDGDILTELAAPPASLAGAAGLTPFVYDFREDRALRRDAQRNLVEFSPSTVVSAETLKRLNLQTGLAVPVRAGEFEGIMFLERPRNLSTDHVDFGEQIAANIVAHVQRHALLKAAEESAEARSRLSLARDLHDSVVQFLAGAAFRLEAMKRAGAAGRDLQPDLDELKGLMLDEQRELRSFIGALRSGSQVGLRDLARDLRLLADRLSRHWHVRCEFSARAADIMVPTRLQVDTQQILREAVANAVRHAGAKSIKIALSAADGSDQLKLEFTNDGTAYPSEGEGPELPGSLSERTHQAGGEIDVARGMGVTKVSITLPLSATRP